jgi:hypothetical protein
MKPLYMEREYLRTKLQMGNFKFDEKDDMLKQIGEMTKILEN